MKNILRLMFCVGFLAVLSAKYVHAQTEKVFFGNLHSHTSFSDGSGKPADAYKRARDVARLDFLAITEHNHAQCEDGASSDRKDGIMIAKDPKLYKGPGATALIPVANQFTQDGKFVAIYGQEFSSISKGNHVNVFDVGEVIDVQNGRFDTLANEWLTLHLDSTGQPAIVQLNHPKNCEHSCVGREYGQDDFGSSSEWVRRIDHYARLIEIVNGPGLDKNAVRARGDRMEDGYLRYLNLGFHIAPAADQDNHYKNWGTSTDARTAVITDELTKAKILEALRNRHVYATEDKNLKVIMHVNGHLLGDRITPPPAVDAELTIDYTVVDDDEHDASYEIQVWSGKIGEGPARMIEAVSSGEVSPTDQPGQIEDIKYTGGAQYVFFKILQLQEDGNPDTVWTAPVWFESTEVAPGPPVDDETANFVASKRSSVYHVSSQCRDAQLIKPENRITGPTAAQGRRKHEGCPR